jgi:hypothetical protein
MKAPVRLFEPITREQNRRARWSALPDRQLYSGRRTSDSRIILGPHVKVSIIAFVLAHGS